MDPRNIVKLAANAIDNYGEPLDYCDIEDLARHILAAAAPAIWEDGYEAAARYHELDTECAAPNPWEQA